MPCLTKRQRQAKYQRTSKGQHFDSGLTECALDVFADPNYQPDNNCDIIDTDDTDSIICVGIK